jgi:hypothetical protein
MSKKTSMARANKSMSPPSRLEYAPYESCTQRLPAAGKRCCGEARRNLLSCRRFEGPSRDGIPNHNVVPPD